MYTTNGVQYFNGIGSLSTPRFSTNATLFVFDWDATVAVEKDVHNLEEAVYPLFHKANGLWTIEAVRKERTKVLLRQSASFAGFIPTPIS